MISEHYTEVNSTKSGESDIVASSLAQAQVSSSMDQYFVIQYFRRGACMRPFCVRAAAAICPGHYRTLLKDDGAWRVAI